MGYHIIHRNYRGGNAYFQAGAALFAFESGTDIRITSDVSMRVNANTVRVVWQSHSQPMPSNIRIALKSIAKPFSATPSYSTDEFWIEFHHPEHAHAALSMLTTMAGFEATLVYNIYFTVSTHVADAAFENLWSLADEIPCVNHVWEKPDDQLAILHLSGTHRGEMAHVRERAERIFLGRTVAVNSCHPDLTRYEIWDTLFADADGDAWLQQAESDTGVALFADRLQERLRVYHRGNSQRNRVEQMLARSIVNLDAAQEIHAIRLSLSTWQAVLASNTLTKAQAVLGTDHVRLEYYTKALFIKCSPRTAQFLRQELGSAHPSIARVEAYFECLICGQAATGIMLSSCEHVLCEACFRPRVRIAESDFRSQHFPLVCPREGCDEPILLSDLRKLVPAGHLHTLLEASVQYHIRSFPEKYRKCRSMECRSVYVCSDSPGVFTCPSCLTQTCTFKGCGAKVHVGSRCEENKVGRLACALGEYEYMLTTNKTFSVTRECPVCTTAIARVHGHKHSLCPGCHRHVCWGCLNGFLNRVRYKQHFAGRELLGCVGAVLPD
ncbi:hypothetical protein M3J07_012443 [Ascochyta lentis]